MDKELINQVLKGLIETSISTKNFILEEAPEVAQQLVSYNIALSIFGIASDPILFKDNGLGIRNVE